MSAKDRDYDDDEDDLTEYLSDGGEFVEPPFVPDYSTAIVVANLPRVPKEKADKLQVYVRKIYAQLGTIQEDGLDMPFDEKAGLTMGFAFVNFTSRQEAEKAIQATNNWNFDKAHVLQVNSYTELVQTQEHPEDYKPEPPRPFHTVTGVYDWLKDPSFRDQFVVRHGKETEVHWAEANGNPVLVYGGETQKAAGEGRYWCDWYVTWSATGAYLLTYHRQGVALWGGAKFDKCARFEHHGVSVAQFSNTDRYLITYSYPQGPSDPPGTIVVWDVDRSIATQQQVPLRSWPVEPYGKNNFFRWSHDDKYLAAAKSKYLRNPSAEQGAVVDIDTSGSSKTAAAADGDQDGQISIFESPSMELLDRKSLRAEGLRGFEWSPKGNIIAYWAPEKLQQPARVVLVEVPSKSEKRRKPLFNVEDCQLFWQSEGDYLCVKVNHKKKGGKKKVSLELFRVKEAGVALEMVEIEPVPVREFAWEPSGHRFAILHGEDPLRQTVSFFSMMLGSQKEANLQHRLEGLHSRRANKALWSPNGGVIVLANLTDDSSLEFFDVDTFTTIMRREDLSRIDCLKWDPSGRYLADAIQQPLGVSYYKYNYDNGFRLWTFQGQLVAHVEKGHFYQFGWRPRPPSLLTPEQQKKIKKDLRKYERRFDKEDREKEHAKQEAEWRRKGDLRRQFRDAYEARVRELRERHAELVALRKGYDSDDESTYEVRVVARRMVPLGEPELVQQ